MKELKLSNLKLHEYLDCHQIQLNYPDIKFRWSEWLLFSNYYEGEFQEGGSQYEGKGVEWDYQEDIYEEISKIR